MAEFCAQCSTALFDKDYKDLANLGKDSPLPSGHGWQALCETCGFTLVDNDGVCIATFCGVHGEVLTHDWLGHRLTD